MTISLTIVCFFSFPLAQISSLKEVLLQAMPSLSVASFLREPAPQLDSIPANFHNCSDDLKVNPDRVHQAYPSPQTISEDTATGEDQFTSEEVNRYISSSKNQAEDDKAAERDSMPALDEVTKVIPTTTKNKDEEGMPDEVDTAEEGVNDYFSSPHAVCPFTVTRTDYDLAIHVRQNEFRRNTDLGGFSISLKVVSTLYKELL